MAASVAKSVQQKVSFSSSEKASAAVTGAFSYLMARTHATRVTVRDAIALLLAQKQKNLLPFFRQTVTVLRDFCALQLKAVTANLC